MEKKKGLLEILQEGLTPEQIKECDALAAWSSFLTMSNMKFDKDKAPVEIFPNEDWRSMAIGFLLAKGLSCERVYELVYGKKRKDLKVDVKKRKME
jgi:hypothetical protein